MKYTYLFMLCVCAFPLFAQTVTISEPITFRRDDQYELVGKMAGHVLVMRHRPNSTKVTAFNDQLKIHWEKELELFGQKPQLVALASDDEKFQLFYLCKEKGHNLLRANYYDAGAVLKDSIVVYDFGKKYFSPAIDLYFSEDENVLSAQYFERGKGLDVMVFDIENKEEKWNRFIPFEESASFDGFLQAVPENDGHVNLVFSKENRRVKKEEHHFDILRIGGEEALIERCTILMPEVLTYDVSFTYDEINKKIIGGGLFSNRNRGKASGYYYLSLNIKNPEGVVFQMHEFSEELAQKLLSDASVKKNEISNIDVREIVLRKDGGIILIAEISRRFERYIAGASRQYNQNGNRSTDYYFEDVLVVSLHPNGDMHWENILYKKQFSQDDNGVFSSFFLAKTPSSLRFLYNDAIKSSNTVSEYILDGAGNLDRNSVLSTRNQKIHLRFPDALQVNAREIIVPSERQSKLKMVRIRY